MDALEVLKRYFGHSAFREGQTELIGALLNGQDVLGVMPTGAGKTVCYQAPAMLLPGVTLVLSPLISLMKDQVSALCQAGVPAAFINSSLTPGQQREALRRARAGAYKIIYVAPERLPAGDFLSFARDAEISLVAVDEAHCVSQWGQDFRPSYLKIPEFISRLPRRPVVGAFTATATREVGDDVARLLELKEPLRLTTGFDRANLFFDVARPDNKSLYLKDFLRRRPDKCGIVYCATRAAVEQVCAELQGMGLPAVRYHAGLEDAERRKNQEDFDCDRARVMVATNAFGMGIDKSNVGFVVHYNMPKNLESYYQEAGRAGRDGERADCVLLFSQGDVEMGKFLINHSNENDELTDDERAEVRRRDMRRLRDMEGYCKTVDCLRAYILNYFGEPRSGSCGSCGNCLSGFTSTDVTAEAAKVLRCVSEADEKYDCGFGAAMFANVLHGGRDKRLLQLRLDRLQAHGSMRGNSLAEIREYIDLLLREGYLRATQGQYPVLCLTDKSLDVLRGERVTLRRRNAPPDEKTSARPPVAGVSAENSVLFEALRALRAKLALAARVPAYVIFTNAALSGMAAKRPRTLDELMEVNGVGEVKAERYGREFLAEIEKFF